MYLQHTIHAVNYVFAWEVDYAFLVVMANLALGSIHNVVFLLSNYIICHLIVILFILFEAIYYFLDFSYGEQILLLALVLSISS